MRKTIMTLKITILTASLSLTTAATADHGEAGKRLKKDQNFNVQV